MVSPFVREGVHHGSPPLNCHSPLTMLLSLISTILNDFIPPVKSNISSSSESSISVIIMGAGSSLEHELGNMAITAIRTNKNSFFINVIFRLIN